MRWSSQRTVTSWSPLHPHNRPLPSINLITCVYNLFQQKVKEMGRCRDEWNAAHISPGVLGLFRTDWDVSQEKNKQSPFDCAKAEKLTSDYLWGKGVWDESWKMRISVGRDGQKASQRWNDVMKIREEGKTIKRTLKSGVGLKVGDI